MIECFNLRGVYTNPLFESGNQERELTNRYYGWRNGLDAQYSRTRKLLENFKAVGCPTQLMKMIRRTVIV